MQFNWNDYMSEKQINSVLAKIHELHPSFCDDDSVRCAADRCHFMDRFPEDYADGDYDADDLYSQLNELRYGFEALYDLFMK